MSSIAFSGALGNTTNAVQIPSTGNEARTQAAATTNQTSGNLKDDTVKLSAAGQAKAMHREGLGVSVIAASLGTDVATVDGYLNIKATTQAATTTVAPSASTGSDSTAATESTSTSTPAATTATASPEAASSSTKAATGQAATAAAGAAILRQ